MRVSVALLGIASASFYGFTAYFSPGAERPAATVSTQSKPVPTYQVAQATTQAETRSDAHPGHRIFSPQQPLMTPASEQASPKATQPVAVQPRKSDPFGEVPVVQAVQPKAAPSSVPSPVATRKAGARPESDDARWRLARDLQQELKRVGCYEGELNGSWNASTKRAMAAFTERVNATLPVEEPDYILMALIQNHQGPACGACPTGQSYSKEGRCVPTAVLAQRDKRGSAGERKDVATASQSPADRAAAMASQLAAAPAAKRTPGTWETGVFPSAANASPPAPPAQQQIVAAPIPQPLPGRMAVGSPPPDEPVYAQPPATGWAQPPPSSGWQAVALPPPGYAYATPPAPPSYRPAPPPPPRASYDRPRRSSSSSLKTSHQVRDFFYGPGRGSY